MAISRSKNRIRHKTKTNSKRRLRGGYGEKVLVDTLCNQANEQTLDKVPELKGIVNGICNGESGSIENSANNNNNTSSNGLLDAAGGFFNSSGATDMASKAIKGFGSVATLPMRIAFGALGKITGFNPMNNATNTDSNNQTNTENTTLQGGNKDVTKLIEKLNTVDKKYLGPEIVEELKNFGQSGGSRRRSRRSRRSRKSKKIRKSRNNKKSLKKKNRK